MSVEELWAQVKALIDEAKAAYADKQISLGEAIGLMVKAVAAFTLLGKNFSFGSSAELRVMVIDAAAKFYTEVIAPMDLPGVPNIFESSVVDPLVGRAVPVIVGELYDMLDTFAKNLLNNVSDPNVLLGLPPKIG